MDASSWPINTRPLNGKQIYNALRDSIVANFGDVGWGAAGMSLTGALFLSIVIHLQLTISLVKYFSPTTNLCIIRVARDHHRIAWGAVTLLTGIDDVRVIPHVVHISGMLLISGRVPMSFTSTTKRHCKTRAALSNCPQPRSDRAVSH